MPSLAALNRIVSAVDVFEWTVTIPARAEDGSIKPVSGNITANTKSEAHARIKSVIGYVPKGTTFEKTGVSPRQIVRDKVAAELVTILMPKLEARFNALNGVDPAAPGGDQSSLEVVSLGDGEAERVDVHPVDAGVGLQAVAAGE